MIMPRAKGTLETKRLILRPITIDDATNMYNNWASDAAVTKYLTWQTHESIQVTLDIISLWLSKYQDDPYYFLWIMVIKDGLVPIGTASIFNIDYSFLSGEVGYCLGSKFWNQGYMTEALQAITKYAFFTNNFQKLVAKHAIENPASGRVMIKCGFKFDKAYIKATDKPYQSGQLLEYCLLKSDYQSEIYHGK